MTLSLAALLLAFSFPPQTVEQDGVRVEVRVRSQQYFWVVTNISAPPIRSFQVRQHNCYAEIAPEGWAIELLEGRLEAHAQSRSAAVEPGRSVQFQVQVSSAGGALGIVPATVGFAEGEPPVQLQIWGPVRMPAVARTTVAVTVATIGVLHALLVARATRRRTRT